MSKSAIISSLKQNSWGITTTSVGQEALACTREGPQQSLLPKKFQFHCISASLFLFPSLEPGVTHSVCIEHTLISVVRPLSVTFLTVGHIRSSWILADEMILKSDHVQSFEVMPVNMNVSEDWTGRMNSSSFKNSAVHLPLRKLWTWTARLLTVSDRHLPAWWEHFIKCLFSARHRWIPESIQTE